MRSAAVRDVALAVARRARNQSMLPVCANVLHVVPGGRGPCGWSFPVPLGRWDL